MLKEKIEMIEKNLGEVKELQEKVQELINERKLKFVDIGLNETVKAIAELMILEKLLDSVNEAMDFDDESIEILKVSFLKSEVPGAEEMLDYVSLKYRDALSDECVTLKKFIDSIKYESVSKELFREPLF